MVNEVQKRWFNSTEINWPGKMWFFYWMFVFFAVVSGAGHRRPFRTYKRMTVQMLNKNWTFKSDWNVPSVRIFTEIPTDVCSALTVNGKIGNIFMNDHYLAFDWVKNVQWKFDLYFATDYNPTKSIKNLVFEGIDTVATIRINENFIGYTENMFLRRSFNIQPYLHNGVNHLEVQFVSLRNNIEIKIMHVKEYTDIGIIPPEFPENVSYSEYNVNYIRKQQSSFGSVATPPIANMAIWKSVYLEPYDFIKITAIQINTEYVKLTDEWRLNLVIHIETNPGMNIFGTSNTSLITDSQTFETSTGVRLTADENGTFFYMDQLLIESEYVSPWWPNGYGSQKLYALTVTYEYEERLFTKSIQIGFRTIELIQKSLVTTKGYSFYFKVNQVPIFIKGAVWIPSSLILRERTEEYECRMFDLLKSAQLANMNMIRVWGGGIYESDFFYNAADKLGLLIWQDFMFNEALYPATEFYQTLIRREVEEQMLRLHHHPSVAIWCGNNGGEMFLQKYERKENYAFYVHDYRKIFLGVIKETVDRIESTRPFVVSTPSNGYHSAAYNYTSSNPNDFRYGDMHITVEDNINVWDSKIYVAPRFSSQSGIQSMPDYETLAEVTTNPDKDLVKFSTFLERRQMMVNGYQLMEKRINKYLKSPRLTKDEGKAFRIFIYYSQIVQAMALKTQIEKYRRLHARFESNGQGGTMGALYWHLNDPWAAPSASSIDYKGYWKILHYFAKKFYSPVIVMGTMNRQKLRIYIVNDERERSYRNLTLRISLYKWTSLKPVHVITKKIDSMALTSGLVYESPLKKFYGSSQCNSYECFVYFSLYRNLPQKDAHLMTVDALTIAPDNFILPVPIRDVVGLRSGVIEKKVYPISETTVRIELKGKSIAAFVWLRIPLPGHFSDNGFLMVTPEKNVVFFSPIFISVEEIYNKLSVVSTSFMNYC